MKISTIKSKTPTVLSICILIIVWKIISQIVDSEIILPSPEKTFEQVALILKSDDFFRIIMTSMKRGLIGFFLSSVLGVITGIITGMNKFIEKMLEPFLIIIKSTPVMSIILLSLIWFETENVPIFVGFLIMFPILCINVSEGIKNIDQDLIQVAKMYGAKDFRIVLEIYLPSIAPFLVSGISTGMGIGWKAIIAAEVLSQPKYGIGMSLYTSKIYIETADVFAWTMIAIIVSFLFEKGIRIVEKKLVRHVK